MDDVFVKTSTTTSNSVTGIQDTDQHCFKVLAVHQPYGPSSDFTDEECATPLVVQGPTWRLQLIAEIDSYDQFQFSGNADWLLRDDQNFLGTSLLATWGYDNLEDVPEPPTGPGNYIKLFFDHPEWEEWVTHFTEDIVLDDDDFFNSNLTEWKVRIQSDVPGPAN